MDKEKIKKFYEHLLENQLPNDVPQESKGFGNEMYTADDWTLDVCNCLMGEKHVVGCRRKQSMFNHLQKIKDDADILLVGEVGRGLDIVIAQMVKEWKWIYCYDHNPVYEDYLHRYFYYDITFHPISSSYFLENNQNIIKREKCIMIMNHSKVRKFELIRRNESIVHLIFDGDLLW